ncbi:MAG TPA: hypothetical protein VEI02_03750 [Planctomycetota bacterium]|nr:hypothetical protein [Planctomycetota bacterium]
MDVKPKVVTLRSIALQALTSNSDTAFLKRVLRSICARFGEYGGLLLRSRPKTAGRGSPGPWEQVVKKTKSSHEFARFTAPYGFELSGSTPDRKTGVPRGYNLIEAATSFWDLEYSWERVGNGFAKESFENFCHRHWFLELLSNKLPAWFPRNITGVELPSWAAYSTTGEATRFVTDIFRRGEELMAKKLVFDIATAAADALEWHSESTSTFDVRKCSDVGAIQAAKMLNVSDRTYARLVRDAKERGIANPGLNDLRLLQDERRLRQLQPLDRRHKSTRRTRKKRASPAATARRRIGATRSGEPTAPAD